MVPFRRAMNRELTSDNPLFANKDLQFVKPAGADYYVNKKTGAISRTDPTMPTTALAGFSSGTSQAPARSTTDPVREAPSGGRFLGSFFPRRTGALPSPALVPSATIPASSEELAASENPVFAHTRPAPEDSDELE